MRSTIAMAAFAALAAGAVGVSALDSNPHMVGSDTLKKLTTAILSKCTTEAATAGLPGTSCGGLTYDGTGSGAGQSALLAGTQSVAPMSRALNTGICSNAGRTTAEGIVVALDGVSIVGDGTNAGSVACNGDTTTSNDPAHGLAIAAGSNGWRDVLRMVYAGMPSGTSTDPLARDCNSAARWNLIKDEVVPERGFLRQLRGLQPRRAGDRARSSSRLPP
jgi:hypothetical protein